MSQWTCIRRTVRSTDTTSHTVMRSILSSNRDFYTYTRRNFFPKVEAKVKAQKFRTHPYGDYLEMTPAGKPGFYFWATEPRFNSNYVGFRNRLGILSEAYSYISFKERIAATKALANGILDVANANSIAIKEVIAKADEASKNITKTDSLAVRAEVVESESVRADTACCSEGRTQSVLR